MKVQNVTISFNSKDAETGEPTVSADITYFNVSEDNLLFIEKHVLDGVVGMNTTATALLGSK